MNAHTLSEPHSLPLQFACRHIALFSHGLESVVASTFLDHPQPRPFSTTPHGLLSSQQPSLSPPKPIPQANC